MRKKNRENKNKVQDESKVTNSRLSSWRFMDKIIRHPMIFTIVTMLILFVSLYMVDRASWILRKIPHHFSGATWFSAIVSLFSVITSVLIGLFAMRQTERLNDLQEYYQRPVMILEYAGLEMAYINRTAYLKSKQQENYLFGKNRIINECKEKNQNKNYAWMTLVLNLVLRNDIGIDSIFVKKMCFEIANTKYEFKSCFNISENIEGDEEYSKLCEFRSFKHEFSSGREKIYIREPLYHLVPNEEAIWEELMQVSQESLTNPNYETVEVEIEIELDFMTDKNRRESIILKTIMGNSEEIDRAIYKITTDSGRIFYKQ